MNKSQILIFTCLYRYLLPSSSFKNFTLNFKLSKRNKGLKITPITCSSLMMYKGLNRGKNETLWQHSFWRKSGLELKYQLQIYNHSFLSSWISKIHQVCCINSTITPTITRICYLSTLLYRIHIKFLPKTSDC